MMTQILFEPMAPVLGCWAFGGEGRGGQNDADSFGAIRTALEPGVKHFDAAQAYVDNQFVSSMTVLRSSKS